MARTFVQDFAEPLHAAGVPPHWAKWAALACLAGVMERRFWTVSSRGILYPNAFVWLVGKAGAGKSMCVTRCEKVWKAAKFEVSPHKLTRAHLEDYILDRGQREHSPTNAKWSLALLGITELTNMVPEWNLDILGFLTEAWDCGDDLPSGTRMHGLKNIQNPVCSFIAGGTPAFLAEMLPRTAWGQGLMSRIILIHDDQVAEPPPMFGEDATILVDMMPGAVEYLTSEAPRLVKFHPSAAAALNRGNKAGWLPIPVHPQLEGYNARRLVHIVKLALALAASESAPTVLLERHIDEAFETLLEAEDKMPQILSGLLIKGHADAISDIYAWIKKRSTEVKRPLNETEIFAYMLERVPTRDLQGTLESLLRSGRIRRNTSLISNTVVTSYTPLDTERTEA